MDKTININLGGILFNIDEDAFRILRDYLQAVSSRFANVQGGHETVEDIEMRIAEIFQSQKGNAGAISKENVEAMITIIGKPEDFEPGGQETDAPQYTSQKKRMFRNPDDKIIGGVSSGIAAYLDTDPVLFRILFVLSAIFLGIGFFVYLGLWIALPEARTESQKKSMYGNSGHKPGTGNYTDDPARIAGTAYTGTSKLGNAINEVFRALGKVFYIVIRILLIIVGVSFVLTGFLFILCFVMIFVFKFPGIFSIDSAGVNMVYLPDFLNYIINPGAVPWIILLTSLVVLLPMFALIYWGVKMIFWFKARDGVVSLVALVVWVMCLAALAIIGFNEGVSFAQTGKSSVETVLSQTPDTIYITTSNKVADLKFQKQISLPHEEYTVFLNDEKKEVYIRPYLSIDPSEDKVTRLEVRRRSTGRTDFEATKKTEDLIYNYSFKKDSLNIDEYFTLHSGRKWAADEIGLNLYIPAGTILKFDKSSRILVHTHFHDENEDYLLSRWESETGSWIMTADGLEPLSVTSAGRK
jgi:phage shock protein PspC (stress-responsive transcriptional regulator)